MQKMSLLVSGKQAPVYKITNRGLVDIGCQQLPISTDNLPIDYGSTIKLK